MPAQAPDKQYRHHGPVWESTPAENRPGYPTNRKNEQIPTGHTRSHSQLRKQKQMGDQVKPSRSRRNSSLHLQHTLCLTGQY